MPLKFEIDDIDGLDESVAGLYIKAQSGGYHLDVDGATSTARVQEFRDKNIELMKEFEKFKGVDPEKFTEYEKIVSQYKKDQEAGKKNLGKDEIDRMVGDRVSEMQKSHDIKLAEIMEERNTYQKKLHNQMLQSEIGLAVGATGALPSAIPDLVWRAQRDFTVENGHLVIKDEKGQIVYDKSGTEPLNVKGWMEQMKVKGSASHLFERPTGSGARGSGPSRTTLDKMSSTDKIEFGLSQR